MHVLARIGAENFPLPMRLWLFSRGEKKRWYGLTWRLEGYFPISTFSFFKVSGEVLNRWLRQGNIGCGTKDEIDMDWQQPHFYLAAAVVVLLRIKHTNKDKFPVLVDAEARARERERKIMGK